MDWTGKNANMNVCCFEGQLPFPYIQYMYLNVNQWDTNNIQIREPPHPGKKKKKDSGESSRTSISFQVCINVSTYCGIWEYCASGKLV